MQVTKGLTGSDSVCDGVTHAGDAGVDVGCGGGARGVGMGVVHDVRVRVAAVACRAEAPPARHTLLPGHCAQSDAFVAHVNPHV